MKSAIACTSVLISLAACPDYAAAQDSGGSSINGLTVLISWLVSTATTCIILGIIWGVIATKKKKKKNREFKHLDLSRIPDKGNDSTRTTGATRTSVETNQTSYSRQESSSSSKPLVTGADGVQYRAGEGVQYRGINRDNSREAPGNRRKTGDVVSKWCNEHDLPEGTAAVLRDNGFLTREVIETLRPEDVPTLCLPTKGQECQLRKVLEELLRSSKTESSAAPPPTSSQARSSGGEPKTRSRSRSGEKKRRIRSQSDFDITNTTGPIQTSTPAPNTPLLDRSKSVHELEDINGLPAPYPGTRIRRSMEELEPVTSFLPGRSTGVILQAPLHSENHYHYKVPGQNNPKGFNGLLSNAGLYEFAGMLGAEWPHLATILGVPPPLQDQLRMDNPSNTKQQIYNMLRIWRDGNEGTKEQLKGAMHDALLRVHRTDLAESLMMEQVDGSNERVGRQKMTSLL